MAIPAYMWIKDDQGARLKGLFPLQIGKGASRCCISIMSCVSPPMVIPAP